MTPHPIDTMPADIAEEALALLYCPLARRGLLRAALVDFATMTLEPTHWLPIPPDPEDA